VKLSKSFQIWDCAWNINVLLSLWYAFAYKNHLLFAQSSFEPFVIRFLRRVSAQQHFGPNQGKNTGKPNLSAPTGLEPVTIRPGWLKSG